MKKVRFKESKEVNGVYIVYNQKERDKIMELKKVLDFYLYKIKVRTSAGKYVFVHFMDIYYIEVLDGQCYLYGSKDIYTSLETFKTLKGKLVGNGFLQCNKIQLINECHLAGLRMHKDCQRIAKLDNGDMILVSRKYKKELDDFKRPQKF